MKNTEYKDIFDFSEEALSIEKQFAFPKFSSINTTFNIGETIRGMSNVNPLATVKFFNQTSYDINKKYFIDAKPSLEGSFTYISDVGSNLDNEIKTTVKDFYYYNKEEPQYFAFRVIMFSSTEATKLKECFEVSKPEDNEILIFVEDNKGDSVSGTYGAMRISQKIIDTLSSKNRLAYDVKDNANIYEELRKIVPELTNGQIKSLLYNGYIEDTRIEAVKTWLKIASFFSSGVSAIFPGLAILTNDLVRKATSNLLGEVINKIEEARLEEYRWQPKAPKNEKGEIDKNYRYQPLISVDEKDNATVNIAQFANLLQKMLDEQASYVKDKLKLSKKFSGNSEPNNLLEFLYHNYFKAYKIAKSVIGQIKELSDIEILKYGAKTYNALLCGVWNGLVDAVSGLFAMVKMIYDGITLGKDFIQNIDKYLPTLLEQFDEAVQAIKKISFTETAKYIYEKLKEINLTFDPVACSYFIGYAFGFIISLIIEIIIGLLVSGGILDIPIIIQKLEEAIFGIFRLGWGLVKGAARKIRTFSKFVVKSIKDLINGFQEFLKFLKGEKGSFKKIIDEVFEASSIKKIGYKGGKILSEAELEDWAKLLMKKYGTKLLKVDKFDKPDILAQFDPNTNTIKYTDDITEYFMAHEHYHAEEMSKIGFQAYVKDAPLAGTKIEDYTAKNWINRYKREKYVYDQLVKSAKNFKLNDEELYHAFIYLDYDYIYQLEIRNIKIPK